MIAANPSEFEGAPQPTVATAACRRLYEFAVLLQCSVESLPGAAEPLAKGGFVYPGDSRRFSAGQLADLAQNERQPVLAIEAL